MFTVSGTHLKSKVVPLYKKKKERKKNPTFQLVLLSCFCPWEIQIKFPSGFIDEKLCCVFGCRRSAAAVATGLAVLCVHPKSLTLWPQPLFLVVVLSLSPFPSPFLSPSPAGLFFLWCLCIGLHEFCCLSFPFSTGCADRPRHTRRWSV